VILVSAAIALSLFTMMRSFTASRIEDKTGTVLQSAIWDHLLKLPAVFFRNYSAGDLAGPRERIEHIRRAISVNGIGALLAAVSSVLLPHSDVRL